MPDICDLILDEHETFRRRFAELDDRRDAESEAVAGIWGPVGELLDRHTDAEEQLFYPELLRSGADPEDETADAISDHNEIRDTVRDAKAQAAGSPAWWDAVERARRANSDHMAEEERGALADLRRHVGSSARDELGARWLRFAAEHAGGRDVDTSDKDVDTYIAQH